MPNAGEPSPSKSLLSIVVSIDVGVYWRTFSVAIGLMLLVT
ncbi:hypothetical protein [Nostoc sp.]